MVPRACLDVNMRQLPLTFSQMVHDTLYIRNKDVRKCKRFPNMTYQYYQAWGKHCISGPHQTLIPQVISPIYICIRHFRFHLHGRTRRFLSRFWVCCSSRSWADSWAVGTWTTRSRHLLCPTGCSGWALKKTKINSNLCFHKGITLVNPIGSTRLGSLMQELLYIWIMTKFIKVFKPLDVRDYVLLFQSCVAKLFGILELPYFWNIFDGRYFCFT